MRRATPIVWLTALFLAWAPLRPADAQPQRVPAAEVVRVPASADELSGYAEREAKARDLEKFEGGRRGGSAVPVTTVIIILLVVIVVILVV